MLTGSLATALKKQKLFPSELDHKFGFTPFYDNHILEYACVIFSIVESFAHKALVAFNCRLRFNGSIMQNVCKALSNLLSCCLMIWNYYLRNDIV